MKYLLILLLAITLQSCGQDTIKTKESTIQLIDYTPKYEWENLAKGIDLCETFAPKLSPISDSRLTIVRMDPKVLDFMLFNATKNKKRKLTAKEWADSLNLNIVINAGMYDMANGLIHRGYMKNDAHFNNKTFNPAYNCMLALNPKDSIQNDCAILDLTCDSWNLVKNDYKCYAQGMRMIDCNGEALGWNKRNQSCSMVVASQDDAGNIYFIFCRSPYTHNDMIGFLKQMPYGLKNTIYLEGGPETSLYIHVNGNEICKFGSYVSQTYPNDDNSDFWQLPNVIGVRLKK